MIHPTILCEVSKIQYDFASKIGTLYAPPNDVPDMTGAIEFFKSIDPEVQYVECFEGSNATTHYKRTGDEWKSILK